MTVRSALVVLLPWLVLACSSERGEPTREDCARLREHVADLAIAQGTAGLSAEERQRHRANLGAATGDDYIEACLKERSEKYVECALEAKTLDDFARCRN
jgi:hypothetical protein